VSARDAILNRIRAARRTGRVPTDGHATLEKHEVLDGLNASASSNQTESLLERFRRELGALGVECHIEATTDAVRSRVVELVGGQSVFGWDPDRLPYGVGKALSSAVTERDDRAVQAAAMTGVTGCDAAIAETGSLAILSGPGTPRAASLLPPVHLCIVRCGDIVWSMGEFFRVRAADIAAAASCTFITGPSRTADIELTLTLGVHGPGRVIVIVGP
jgi:L-lactate dehydrogenase complex protein LldG